MAIDLHVHSTASDGTLAPSALVEEAAALGLSALAIADHDSVDGVAEGIAAGSRLGVEVVPAVELSAADQGRDVHVLGYFVDYADVQFRERLAALRQARLARARRIVEALHQDGFAVDLDEVLSLADGAAVGRSHVARALVERGHAEDVAEAFERFIGRGKPYYIAKEVTSPEEVVSLIAGVGGLAILAHPAVSEVEDLVERLVPCRLAGVEAYHAEHTTEQTDSVLRLAVAHGLLVTGGSDYHGPGTHGAMMGDPHVPDEVLERLREAVAECRS